MNRKATGAIVRIFSWKIYLAIEQNVVLQVKKTFFY